MLLSILYVHVLVYRRVVKYVPKHYICTCASIVKYVAKIIYAHVLVYRRVVKYVAK